MLACFTSTPSEAGEKALINEHGDSAEVDWEFDHDVGAGDSVVVDYRGKSFVFEREPQ